MSYSLVGVQRRYGGAYCFQPNYDRLTTQKILPFIATAVRTSHPTGMALFIISLSSRFNSDILKTVPTVAQIPICTNHVTFSLLAISHVTELKTTGN